MLTVAFCVHLPITWERAECEKCWRQRQSSWSRWLFQASYRSLSEVIIPSPTLGSWEIRKQTMDNLSIEPAAWSGNLTGIVNDIFHWEFFREASNLPWRTTRSEMKTSEWWCVAGQCRRTKSARAMGISSTLTGFSIQSAWKIRKLAQSNPSLSTRFSGRTPPSRIFLIKWPDRSLTMSWRDITAPFLHMVKPAAVCAKIETQCLTF